METTERQELEKVRRENPIVEVLKTRGIQLHPEGDIFVGRCPLHPANGHPPSLVVNPQAGLWKCKEAKKGWPCAEGGDVVQLVSKLDRVSPAEALARLQKRTAPAVVEMDEGILFTFENRAYRVRPLSTTLDQLRAQVKAFVGEGFHVDVLDLYSARSRSTFANRLSRLDGSDPDRIENHLSLLIAELEKTRGRKPVKAEPEKPTMTEEEKAEAVKLLKDPGLLTHVVRHLDRLGYVGEPVNKKLLYLVAVSRKLEDPLSAILISQSSAGKSGLAEAIEKMIPPEDVVFYSRLTPQALYYMEKDFLKRKLVVIEERAGSEAADYSIRTLQTRHKLIQAAPIKDPNTGEIKTRTFEVEGPASFLEATTNPQVNFENSTRCFEVYLDESSAQTARIHKAQREAKTLPGLKAREEASALSKLHHNAQRLLREIKVAIPFAPLITFPRQWLRTRRDHLRFLNLIEVLAFVHQYQRPLKKEASGLEYVEASIDDYRLAYELARDVLRTSLDVLKRPSREALDIIRVKAAGNAFSRRDARAWTGLPNHQVKRIMAELEDLEFVEATRGPRGGRFEYRLVAGDLEEDTLSGLLSPAEIEKRWESQARRVTGAPATG